VTEFMRHYYAEKRRGVRSVLVGELTNCPDVGIGQVSATVIVKKRTAHCVER
jgi:hypothetical protein